MADTLNYNPNRASRVNDNALTVLIRRLEAATSRLEDIATSAVGFDQQDTNGLPAASTDGLPATASAPDLSDLAKSASAQAASAPTPSLPKQVAALDELMETVVEKYISASKQLDSPIQEQVRKHLPDRRNKLIEDRPQQ